MAELALLPGVTAAGELVLGVDPQLQLGLFNPPHLANAQPNEFARVQEAEHNVDLDR